MLPHGPRSPPFAAILEKPLEKKSGRNYGPPGTKRLIYFIDDLNMPMLETYGAQPPIELLRQWMDHQGWYDRKQIGTTQTFAQYP